MVEKLRWMIKQIFPFGYTSVYKVDGIQYISIWKQWFGKAYKHRAFEVTKEISLKDVFVNVNGTYKDI
jgi:hypothetical protein